MKLFKNIEHYLTAKKVYFIEARDEISRSNIEVLFLASVIAMVMLFVLILITPLIITGWSVTPEYLFLSPLLMSFVVFSYLYKNSKNINYIVTQTACLLFYVVLISFFIVLNVYTEPFRADSFLALCFMFMPTLFIIQPYVISTLSAVTEVVFIILALKYKSNEVVDHDIFVTIVALLFSNIISWIVCRLRTQNYFSRVKFQKLSMTDMLTGILNKSTFDDCCRAYISPQHQSEAFVLCIIDVDNFKSINDTYGHQQGDQILSMVGTTLRSNFRSDDIVGRVGGDEFCVIMKGISNAELACKKLEKVRRALAQVGGNGCQDFSCSIGAALHSSAFTTYERMYKLADEALYKAKSAGKNRIVFLTA